MNKRTFLSEYKKLNPQQRQAVEEIEGPVMVIAGPGTGKTQILAMRIANILRLTQTNPQNILCLTFTNSGVQAMKKRLLDIIGPSAYQVHVHTFHQFCNEIIAEFPEKFLSARELNQLTDLEQIQLIQKILSENNFSHIKPFKSPFHYQKAILEAINTLKQENISPKQFSKHIARELKNFQAFKDLCHEKGPSKGKMKGKYRELREQIHKNQELATVYYQYQKHLQKEGQYDFADMILFVVSGFKTDAELLSHFQEKFQYILADEYQDTNSAQNEVIEILGNFYENPNIFVVGDDEQSIYRFQGASLENILFFKNIYPAAKIVILEHNYRSGQKILDASRAVISKNKNQIYRHLKVSKNLKSRLKDIKSEIHLGEFSTGSVENFFVAKEIQKLVKEGIAPSEIAVLYREHRDSEELIDFLSKLDVPYKLEIGDNVIADPEIIKILKYFRCLALEKDSNELLVEIMHYPYFNLAPLDIYKIIVAARIEKKAVFDILANLKKYNLELEKPETLREFYQTFMDCRKITFTQTFAAAFEYITHKSGYLQYLLTLESNVRHFNRLQSLFEYIKLLNLKQKNLNLLRFLEHLQLLDENRIPIRERELVADWEGVNLMTAHKAKGLEFSYVFIIRTTDHHWGNIAQKELIKLPTTLLKIQKLTSDNDNLSAEALAKEEEERRLFYVAMTRAKTRVYLTFADSYGDQEFQTLALPSKFIGEIPAKFVNIIDTGPFEKNFDERLKLTFSLKKWEYAQAMRDFLQKLVADFSLNPTALNSYLDCPQQFLYDNILRVPKAKTFTQSYGTAVHRGLEMFFRDFAKTLKLPSKKKLLKWFEDGLQDEILDEKEQERARQNGTQILSAYYDFYKNIWRKQGRPLSCEMNFSSHNVHFENIPITGKIDKIEVLSKTAGMVRLVDYKTTTPKSLNFLLGKTKEKNTDYLYQAYFYKLLCESDPLFSWKVGEIVFDFISDRGFRQVAIPIERRDFDNFKELVRKVYTKIIALEFPHDSRTCKKRKEGSLQRAQSNCPYLPFCQRSNLL